MTTTTDFSDTARVAAGLIDRLEEDYADKGEVRLGVVALVVEVEYEDGGEEYTCIEYRCSDARRWIQLGLFEAARRGVIHSGQLDDDDDD